MGVIDEKEMNIWMHCIAWWDGNSETRRSWKSWNGASL